MQVFFLRQEDISKIRKIITDVSLYPLNFLELLPLTLDGKCTYTTLHRLYPNDAKLVDNVKFVDNQEVSKEIRIEEEILTDLFTMIEWVQKEEIEYSNIYELIRFTYNHRSCRSRNLPPLLWRLFKNPKIDPLYLNIVSIHSFSALEVIDNPSSDRLRAHQYLMVNLENITEIQKETLLPTIKANLLKRLFLLYCIVSSLPKDIQEIIIDLHIL